MTTFWKCLFAGTRPVNKTYPTGTVSVIKSLLTGTLTLTNLPFLALKVLYKLFIQSVGSE